MVSIDITYNGKTQCTLVHESGATIGTGAPRDIGGDGDRFSPTDLIAAGLASCILTTVAMWAKRNEIELDGATAHVTKEMTTTTPRRISRLATTITIPADKLSPEQRTVAEKIAHTCPVHQSLHPDVEAPIEFVYG